MTDNVMVYVWLGLTIVFAITEAATAQLTTIWFAAGSLTAMLLTIFGVQSLTVQVVAFLIVSVVTLIVTRPIVKKVIHKDVQPTNADRNIGETGIVTEEINNINGTGAVKVNGTVWTARSIDDTVIAEETLVKVVRIEGVKVIAQKID